MSETKYCIFCDNEATNYYRRPGKIDPVPLCSTCFQAFEVGLSLDYDNTETGHIDNMEDGEDDLEEGPDES